jgi:peptide/nickel transport system ATP-binding protein
MTDQIATKTGTVGDVVLEAVNISRDYYLGRGRSGPVLSAVREVSLSLYRRGVVAIVGESGSGKSTVARMLAGQETLTSGEVRLDGNVVHVKHRKAFRAYKREVQMVFQDPFASLNSVHTVRHHLMRPIKIHRGIQGRQAIEEEMSRLLNLVSMTPPELFLPKYPHELSGGQRQRVAIARAIAASPRVLLADEPISMLDVSIRLDILRLLSDLRETLELAMLYITHDIASARYVADEILVMYAGEIVERGPAEEVTQKPAHPYTQLLVSSAPNPDALGSSLRTGTKVVPGQAGSALSSIVGCRFSPRCPFADEQCRSTRPPIVPTNDGRLVACWHLDQAASSSVTIAPKSRATRTKKVAEKPE